MKAVAYVRQVSPEELADMRSLNLVAEQIMNSERPDISPLFSATWDGECATCGTTFWLHDQVGYVNGELTCYFCWDQAIAESYAE